MAMAQTYAKKLATPYYDPVVLAQKKAQNNTANIVKGIGSFGNHIIFETNDKKILTFDSFNQSISSRWTAHERIGLKPKQEFLGPSLRSITFNIVLNAMHGIKPRETMEKIEKIIEEGIVDILVIGTKQVGQNKWAIKDMSETWDTVMNKGELLQATLSLSLEEYL